MGMYALMTAVNCSHGNVIFASCLTGVNHVILAECGKRHLVASNLYRASRKFIIEKMHSRIPSAKWRPFLSSLNIFKRLSTNVEMSRLFNAIIVVRM